MRVLKHMLFMIGILTLVGSCNKNNVYEQKSKTLDSLSGAINSMVNELQKTDTLLLKRALNRFNWYGQFIHQNINDTITKSEADALQHFYSSGQTLSSVLQNHKKILAHASLINSQVASLSLDIKNKHSTPELIIRFTEREKTEAAHVIEAGYYQQRLFLTCMEEFGTSLKEVEHFMRSRNNGELPTIIKDTINL